MTDVDHDKIADWHAQFAPKPAGTVEGAPRPELADQVAVEHLPGDDGVFGSAKAEPAVEGEEHKG